MVLNYGTFLVFLYSQCRREQWSVPPAIFVNGDQRYGIYIFPENVIIITKEHGLLLYYVNMKKEW